MFQLRCRADSSVIDDVYLIPRDIPSSLILIVLTTGAFSRPHIVRPVVDRMHAPLRELLWGSEAGLSLMSPH